MVWPKRLDSIGATHLAMGMAGLVGKRDQTHSTTHLVTWQRLAVQPGQRRHVRRASHHRPRWTGVPAKDRLPAHGRRHAAMRLLEPCNRLSKSSTRWTFGSWWVARSGRLEQHRLFEGQRIQENTDRRPGCRASWTCVRETLPGTAPELTLLSESASASGPVARARNLALPSLAPLRRPSANLAARRTTVPRNPTSLLRGKPSRPSGSGGGPGTRWTAVDAADPASASRARSTARGTTSSAHHARRCRPWRDPPEKPLTS
jgi:hypothetical protein